MKIYEIRKIRKIISRIVINLYIKDISNKENLFLTQF